MITLSCVFTREEFLRFANDILEGTCKKKHRNSKVFLTIKQFKGWEPLVDVADCDFSCNVTIDIPEPQYGNFDKFLNDFEIMEERLTFLEKYGFVRRGRSI